MYATKTEGRKSHMTTNRVVYYYGIPTDAPNSTLDRL